MIKDDEQNPVAEMYPIFMSLPAVYLKPKNMPKVSRVAGQHLPSCQGLARL